MADVPVLPPRPAASEASEAAERERERVLASLPPWARLIAVTPPWLAREAGSRKNPDPIMLLATTKVANNTPIFFGATVLMRRGPRRQCGDSVPFARWLRR